MQRKTIRQTTIAAGLVALFMTVVPVGNLFQHSVSADSSNRPCPELLVPQHTVQKHMVGETDCQITSQSTVPDDKGRAFNRVDIALSGTAFGYADPVTKGNTRKDLTDAPNILFPQFGITSWVPGVGTYSGAATATDAGAGLSVLYPDQSSHTPWNGKVFVLVHGQSNNSPLGTLPTRHDGQFTNDTFDNLYASEMIDKGYAVIYTRRPAASGVPTKLDGSATILDESLNDNVDTMMSFIQTGEKLIRSKLGKAPTSVYWYGHSAGVILGRLINYSGLNFDAHGKRYIDGFLDDDPGGGLPLPVSMPEGNVLGEQGNMATYAKKDQIFANNPAARDKFTKEITFAHDLYEDAHTWLPKVSYLDLKREGAQMMQQQGLGNKTRFYEISSVSHIANTSTSPTNTLDIGGLVDAGITLLDKWVQKNDTPPATIANFSQLGKTDSDSNVLASQKTQQAIKLPPIACPTGMRYAGPPPAGGTSTTGYIAFNGRSLEPVNANGVLVDVNGNGVRDTMPNIQQAWRTLGLLGSRDALTKSVYTACVQHSVDSLTRAGLLSQEAASYYIQQARNYPALPW